MRQKKPKRPPRPEAPPQAGRPPEPPPGHVAVGAIAGPQGVRGQVRIKSFTAEPEDVAAYGPVMTADGRHFRLRVEGAAKGVLIARIEGIDTRNVAETLKGVMLYVPRHALPEAEEEEFYHADLIGLQAVRTNGDRLGRVSAVHDFGAGDLLEIALDAEQRTVLLPFTRETVPEIDLQAGRLVCEPPEGLLEAAAAHEKEEDAS